MDAFKNELRRRSPLAGAAIEISDFVLDDTLLKSIWDAHRGPCYEDVLKFEDFVRLMRDALVNHGGSAHQLYRQLESRKAQPVDESNFYRKLARTPVPLSRALLREGTARLGQLMPGPVVALPSCFDSFCVIAADGKKIKNATKRLKPTRGYSGKLLGAKALVALDVRSGLAIAMSDSLDGLSNDVPLVPALMEQVRQIIAGPILSVWDRQFDGLQTLDLLAQRPGDAFVVRVKKTGIFAAESAVERVDAQGRRVLDEIGRIGSGKRARRLRRITLVRGGEEGEDVIVLTNLMDRSGYDALEILGLYKKRWNIEQVFQQITQTFSLQHLIGCAPQAVLLQFAYCLLLYNLVQVIQAYVAQDGKVLASVISTYYLFLDLRQELTTWAYHTDGAWPRIRRTAAAMRARLRQLLKGAWDPILYTKASDKKPRAKPKPPKRLHGGHTSVQRLLDGTAKVVATP